MLGTRLPNYTGNKNKVTITNNQFRFSKEDVERMVQEAEKLVFRQTKGNVQACAQRRLEGRQHLHQLLGISALQPLKAEEHLE